MTLRLTVLGVDEEGGASLALLADDVEITTVTADMEKNAGFTRKQAEATQPIPENAGFLPKLALALARSAARVDVRADGSISDVSGMEDVYALAAKEGAEGNRVLGPMAPNSIKRTLATLFRVDVASKAAPFTARKAGETWEIPDRSPAGAGMDLVSTLRLKLDECMPERATITGSGVISIEPSAVEPGKEPAKPDPAQPIPSVDEQADAVAITWDTKAGVVRKRTRDALMAVSSRVGSTKINPVQVRTRSTLELVDITE